MGGRWKRYGALEAKWRLELAHLERQLRVKSLCQRRPQSMSDLGPRVQPVSAIPLVVLPSTTGQTSSSPNTTTLICLVLLASFREISWLGRHYTLYTDYITSLAQKKCGSPTVDVIRRQIALLDQIAGTRGHLSTTRPMFTLGQTRS